MKKLRLTGQSTHCKLPLDFSSTLDFKAWPVYVIKCVLQIILFGITGACSYIMEKPFISVPHNEMGCLYIHIECFIEA